eukprot:TRINITY_DN9697_c0_g1_i2.p1 TRINITY_DN9697_c0_g1~~TRINITY_DN9697_c0_g1_i2.p1  ORF type:complete len:556 (+),score=86.70 TRINITY_DN9697_c0_g1_i2:146-1669(+)
MRNEQAASYAASVVGYLTQKPAICLTVAGPGLVHALPGLLNATANCWPMILISSGAWTSQVHMGSFQEAPQIESARQYAKYCVRVESLHKFAYYFEQAVRNATYGRPGGVYIELAREVLTCTIDHCEPLPLLPLPPITLADPEQIQKALQLLQSSKSPLVIIGRGAAYSRAEEELKALVESFGIPFLSSPMGKGVVSDKHPLCVSAARSLALSDADVIIIVGARLNWMFNFGQEPGFSKSAKIIQIDICPEELHHNRRSDVTLQGDARAIIKQLLGTKIEIDTLNFEPWKKNLQNKCEQNAKLMEKKIADKSNPMKYHYVLNTIDRLIPQDAIIVNEGANTMDIGRVTLTNRYPRCRLDAGTLGTMGVGVGYAIAGALCFPDRKIVAIQGDSAFGFSGMEIEVAVRYSLNITFIVLNNNGIYCGQTHLDSRSPKQVPPTSLSPNIQYQTIMQACGGQAFYVEEPSLLEETVQKAISTQGPSLLHIKIDPQGPIPTVVANSKIKTNVH